MEDKNIIATYNEFLGITRRFDLIRANRGKNGAFNN